MPVSVVSVSLLSRQLIVVIDDELLDLGFQSEDLFPLVLVESNWELTNAVDLNTTLRADFNDNFLFVLYSLSFNKTYKVFAGHGFEVHNGLLF